jgi:hypothetical protein
VRLISPLPIALQGLRARDDPFPTSITRFAAVRDRLRKKTDVAEDSAGPTILIARMRKDHDH